MSKRNNFRSMSGDVAGIERGCWIAILIINLLECGFCFGYIFLLVYLYRFH